jgi:hypothetical protein
LQQKYAAPKQKPRKTGLTKPVYKLKSSGFFPVKRQPGELKGFFVRDISKVLIILQQVNKTRNYDRFG